jgi:hypothetical protein
MWLYRGLIKNLVLQIFALSKRFTLPAGGASYFSLPVKHAIVTP